LNNHEEASAIGKKGKEHCLKHHTTTGRAKYFLEKVEEKCKIKI